MELLEIADGERLGRARTQVEAEKNLNKAVFLLRVCGRIDHCIYLLV